MELLKDLPFANIKFDHVRLIDPSQNLDETGSLIIRNGTIVACGAEAANQDVDDSFQIYNGQGAVLAPGLVDMRTFVGEPGAEHRETLASASEAAASGGITTIVTMPDTSPVIDDGALVDFIMRRARDTAIVHVHTMAGLTKGLAGEQITEIGLLQEAGAVAFTDGRGTIANSLTMKNVLTYARDFDALVVHHVEDPFLKGNGVMNAGEMATRYGLPGIPWQAETIMLDRDLQLLAMTGGRYMVAQLSCKEAVERIRRAKASGLSFSCGVSINHLSLNENDIGAWRSFLKMSPPLRSEDDRLALVEGVRDGTIDVIVSAHDPQDVEMKRHPFADAADGAAGLETMLAAGLRLVHDESLSLLRLIDSLSTTPARLLGLEAGTLQKGAPADLVLFDLHEPWVLDRKTLKSRSKNSPFENARFSGRVHSTYVSGKLVYQNPAND
jgi:dihydroorotase